MNCATIAKSGVIPFTKAILEHPEIREGGLVVLENRAAVAAAAAGGGLNLAGLNVKLEQVRELARLRLEKGER